MCQSLQNIKESSQISIRSDIPLWSISRSNEVIFFFAHLSLSLSLSLIMSHPSSKNNAIRQFKNLDINDIPNENNGIEESTSSCTLPLAFQVDEMNKDQSDCGGRSIMGGKRGPYLCRDVSRKYYFPYTVLLFVLNLCPFVIYIRIPHRDGTENKIRAPSSYFLIFWQKSIVHVLTQCFIFILIFGLYSYFADTCIITIVH